MPGWRSGLIADEVVCERRSVAFATGRIRVSLHPMIPLLRALTCLILAVAMASVSLGVAAHSIVVIDELSIYSEATIDDLPCADCGSHRLRTCAQSCSASLDPLEPAISLRGGRETTPKLRRDDAMLHGLSRKPQLTPPIA